MIRSYDTIEVILERATEEPMDIIKQAAGLTVGKEIKSDGIVKSLLKKNHTSLFEHVNYTFLIKGASRSFLAQITRHRIGSFTSGSQHYQDYTDKDFVMDEQHSTGNEFIIQRMLQCYKELRARNVPRYEARQALPMGIENDLMWTVNARSLVNFLNLRMCLRNVPEMRTVAEKVGRVAYWHFPQLFSEVGPDCVMSRCKQGEMACGQEYVAEMPY
jgi:thymidylate synthase (FAD)